VSGISVDEPPAAPADDLLAEVTVWLAQAGVPTPVEDARLIITHFGGADAVGLRARIGDVPGLRRAVERRAAREPLEYITGVARFRSLELAVGPGVFVPRRESEVAAQLAVDELRRSASAVPVAVDLGTGSGAIALALASEVPGACVYGVEVSPAAFHWTERNFRALAPQHGRPLLADLSDALPELDGQVDVVVANPPYIPAGAIPRDPEVRLHSPEISLFGGPDGLDLVRAVSRTGRRLLRAGGLLVVEHGELQAQEIADLLQSDGWSDIDVSRDQLCRERATAARARQDEV
jgi:release factor glutamine methyltransferase